MKWFLVTLGLLSFCTTQSYVHLAKITNNTDYTFQLNCHRFFNWPVTVEGEIPTIEPGQILDQFEQTFYSEDETPAVKDPNPNSIPCKIHGSQDIPDPLPDDWKLPVTCVTNTRIDKKGNSIERSICVTNSYEQQDCAINRYVITAQETIIVTPKKQTKRIKKTEKKPQSVCVEEMSGKAHLIISTKGFIIEEIKE